MPYLLGYFRRIQAVIVAGLILTPIGNLAHANAAPQAADLAERCGALRSGTRSGVDFSRIPDAPTYINEAKLVTSARELIGSLSGADEEEFVDLAVKQAGGIQPYCRVTGYVTPNIRFELLLPVNHWNGKFLHVGCGGWCGTTGKVELECPKYPDYACIATDMGHTGRGMLWSRGNLQAQIDFSYRATHVVTLAGKAITERFYASRPRRSYFMGCSTGGYQGMVEAQRFPSDFDGIVAGAPDMDESDLSVRDVWIQQHFFGPDGKPVLSLDDLKMLHAAALAECDMDDGVRDGIISDPLHCKFDPAKLLCKSGTNNRCLSAEKVQAAKSIYGPPMTSAGVPLSTRGVLPGSELDWIRTFPWIEDGGEAYFRALLDRPDGGRYSNFDFDRDYLRAGVGVWFPDTNPDLRRFKATGGKLIAYQGGNDTQEYPPAVFDYYETVEKTMGGRAATQEFFRLFMVPGMDHCTDGDGAFAIDYLSYLEAWVEQGKAPDMMIGAHPDGLKPDEGYVLKLPLDPSIPIGFTRPIYPYPLYAKYKGRGDPNKAQNFRPVSADSAH